MPRRFPKMPKKAHASGQARIFWRGRTIYLGVFGSPQSLAEYNRLLAEWTAENGAQKTDKDMHRFMHGPLTIAHLVSRYLTHARAYYRRADGSPAVEVKVIEQTVKPLLVLYGRAQLEDFGPKALKEVQQAMADGSWVDKLPPEKRDRRKGHPAPVAWSRKTVNSRLGKLKRMFKWAVSEELIPAEIYERLRSVPGLRRGHTHARERPEVPPVPDSVVEAVLPHLGPVVGAMVRLQRLTGMRPGEVCSLRPMDLDKDSLAVEGKPIWIFRPPQHKTAHLGRGGAIVIGPKAQEVLTPFLDRPAEAFCFSPEEATAAHHRGRVRGKSRATATRYKRAARYSLRAYEVRINRACKRAGVPRWTPNQLRHSAATEIAAKHGLDAARVVLRHADPKVTTVYAARDLQQAAEIISRLG